MSVLSRELDSYQRAVDAYQRKLNKHNRGAQRYQDTIARDGMGDMMVVDESGQVFRVDDAGKLTPTELPEGKSLQDYGLSAIPDESRFRMLRVGDPVEQKRETRNDVQYVPGFTEGGMATDGSYLIPVTGGGDGGGANFSPLSPEWRMERKIPGQPDGDADRYTPEMYEFSRDASTYMAAPAEFDEKFNRQAPDPSMAQARAAARPNMAMMEAGLIGEVMRGKGVRGGVPVYRPPGNTPPPGVESIEIYPAPTRK